MGLAGCFGPFTVRGSTTTLTVVAVATSSTVIITYLAHLLGSEGFIEEGWGEAAQSVLDSFDLTSASATIGIGFDVFSD